MAHCANSKTLNLGATHLCVQIKRLSGINFDVCFTQVLMIDPDTPDDQIRKAYRKVYSSV